MGLSYHFAFRAPETATPEELKAFLDDVEGDAKLMGFDPTAVVCGPFDTPERREFARRVARGFSVEADRLRGVRLRENLCWTQHPSAGSCRLAPVFGCFLVVADERRVESVFGFFRYPQELIAESGSLVMHSPLGNAWQGSGCIDSPDRRYRSLVRRFAEAGYLEYEHDEFDVMRKEAQ